MNLTKFVKGLFPSSQTHVHNAMPIDFVQSHKGILREIVLCMQSGNMIGVYSPVLGDGLFLLGVEDLVPDAEEGTVIFHPEEATGLKLKKHRLTLREIDTVVPINKKFSVVTRSIRRRSVFA